MVINEEPYFLSNKDWFYYDEEEFCYKLTDKATKEAIKSYEEFYELLDGETNTKLDKWFKKYAKDFT